MRFGRYIVGLPSQDNDTLHRSQNTEAPPSQDNEQDVNGSEQKDADAIV
ncbi:MAG TPA: hypothetical protein VFO10_27895 [Oligoflexus sp.]|nr:hypothetical protein [Oligoflexus sp.]HET9241120.1 hypothetical protein [Oligoflexus sp.]